MRDLHFSGALTFFHPSATNTGLPVKWDVSSLRSWLRAGRCAVLGLPGRWVHFFLVVMPAVWLRAAWVSITAARGVCYEPSNS